MHTLSIVLLFFSVWCLFATAKRVTFHKVKLTLLLSEHTKVANLLALVLFVIATGILFNLLGVVIGILTTCLLWMVMACTVVLFAPFQVLRWPFLTTLAACFFLIEGCIKILC